VEAAINIEDAFGKFLINVQRWINSSVVSATLYINGVDNGIYIIDKTLGSYKVYDAYIFERNFKLFRNMKLVADFNTGKYVRALFDDIEIDLTQFTLDESATSNLHELTTSFSFESNNASIQHANIAHLILTSNEP